jgi:RNA polymerase sigma factor (sigma-70 family)
MAADSSFDALMARLRAGDDQAARRVFAHFTDRLIALARARLDGLVRGKVGAEDVVQSVWRVFFRRCAEAEYDLENWDSLWSLLALITVRKCWRKIQEVIARPEVPYPGDADGSNTPWQPPGREPTPEEAALLADLLAEVMRGLEPKQRDVLELRLQGYTVREISARVGLTEYTVEYVLKRIRKRLKRLLDEDEPGP